MPPIVIAAIIAAGAGAGTTYYAAKKNEESTDAAVNAQKYSADLQAQGNKEALDFTKAQGENSFQNQEVSRRGNYDQWVAAQKRLSTLGSLIGAAPREIPSYVPGVDPHLSGTGPTTGANYTPLVSALNGGQSPQSVIDQFNQAQGPYNGESYAWRSIPNAPGGGVVEIPGGAYLAPGSDGKWGYTAAPNESAGTTRTSSVAAAPKLASSQPNYLATSMAPALSMFPTIAALMAQRQRTGQFNDQPINPNTYGVPNPYSYPVNG